MPRDITVTFDDGATHVYRGAPDDVTPDAVQQRAEKEFGKAVTALDGGRKAGLASVDNGGRGEVVVDGMRPSNLAGAGRSASVGGLMPSEIPAEGLGPVARRGGMRAVRPYVAGDERIIASPSAPPASSTAPTSAGSVLDRSMHDETLALRQRQAAQAFDPNNDAANVAASVNPDQAQALAQERVRRDREAAGQQPTGTVRGLNRFESAAAFGDRTSPTGMVVNALRPNSGDKSAVGFVRDTAADAIAGWRQGVPDLVAAGYGGVRAAADLVGAERVAQWAGLSANAAQDFAAQFNNPNGDKAVSGAFRSLSQALALGAAAGPMGAAGLLAGTTAGNQYTQLRDMGFAPDAAIEGATVFGIAEYLGERVGMPGLARIVKGIASKQGLPLRQALIEALKQQGEEQVTTAIQSAYDKLGRAGTRPNMTWADYLNDVVDTAQQTAIMTAAAGAGGVAKKGALTVAQRALGAPPAAPTPDPYAQAAAAGFHVEPPLLTDTPQDQRKKTEAILDGVAAMYGVPPKVVQMLRAGAEGKPLANLGPAYARGIEWLQQRGLVPADIAPEVMQALGHGAIQPIAEQPAAAPVAESQAPGRSADGEGGAAPTRAGGGPQPSTQDAAVSGIEGTLRAAGALADMSDLDAAAHEAATSPLNDHPEPSDAQKEAGNYRKGHTRISGLDVAIENPAGSMRRSKADEAKPWEVQMPAHYGYIKGTKGADGDHVDIFVGPGGDNGRFWVINQNTPDGKKFDEHKVVTGVDTADEAVALYKASFADGFGDRVFASVGTEMGAQRLRELLPSLERPKPSKPQQVRLQNRNRSDAGYVQQMQSIAANPDPGRLGFSRDFASGAPVVLDAGSTPGATYGRNDYVTSSKGRRIPVRYAVVEAESLLPSNTADGGRIAEYEAGAPGRARVVAGNGRAAGLVAGYGKGKTDAYRSGLAEDAALHGIDADTLAKFKQPVLVREMRTEDVTADIGDESNVSGIAERSPPEVARDDARRVDLADIEVNEDGRITDHTLAKWVAAQPVSEQTNLREKDGNPVNQKSRQRLTSAIFAAAYENDSLLELQSMADDPEARTVLAGLVAAAPAMVQLKGSTHDIRALVAEAAIAAVNARRRGIKLADMAAQADLDADPEITPVLEMFARNIRSAKRIGDNLRTAATRAREEASRPAEDMFGEVPRRTRQQVLTESFDDTTGAQNLGEQAGAESDARAARGRGSEPDSARGVERPAGSAASQETAERPARTGRAELIELRKRLSVLESLRACLSS